MVVVSRKIIESQLHPAWEISKREGAHHTAVKENIRLTLNWMKPYWATATEMWCTCPCGVSSFDSPCHLLASKTSANKILLRFEKQSGSAWENLAALTAVVRVHRAHTIGPGTATSATLSIWLSVLHPMLCRFCFCWQKLFSQCQKMSQSLQCKMIFFHLSHLSVAIGRICRFHITCQAASRGSELPDS